MKEIAHKNLNFYKERSDLYRTTADSIYRYASYEFDPGFQNRSLRDIISAGCIWADKLRMSYLASKLLDFYMTSWLRFHLVLTTYSSQLPNLVF